MNRVTLIATAVLGIGCSYAPAARAASRPVVQSRSVTPVAARQTLIWDFKSELGLTDAQIQGMKSQAASAAADSARLADQLSRDEDALRDLVAQDAPLAQERVEVERIGAASVEARMLDLSRAKSVLAVLTPGQRAKWRDLQATRRTSAHSAR